MAESFVKIMRIKEMIIIQRSFDCKTNSPHQYQRKHKEKRLEDIDTDVRVSRVNWQNSLTHTPEFFKEEQVLSYYNPLVMPTLKCYMYP